MMLAVWKYPLPFPTYDEFNLTMQKGAKVLTVQVQGDQPCIWALIDASAPTEVRRFRVAGTGHWLEQERACLDYVGTFQLNDGQLVFHLFEIPLA